MKNLLPSGQASFDFTAPLQAIAPAAVKVTRQRQKHITLRVHPRTGALHVRAPRHVSKAAIQTFLFEQRDWVAANVNALPPAVALADGATIPFMGGQRAIRFDASRTRGVSDDGISLTVGGDPATIARRLRLWLVERARREVTMRTRFYAAMIGRTVSTIAVRDMHSRWGSCTQSSGRGTRTARLGFNWRLVLAPLHVLDYVVAHEVAHLIHMNHSPDFWRLVQQLMGDYEPAERWLEVHGHELMRIGG